MDLDSSLSSRIFDDQMVSSFILKHFEISSEAQFTSLLGSLLLTSLKTQQVKKHSIDFFSVFFLWFVCLVMALFVCCFFFSF